MIARGDAARGADARANLPASPCWAVIVAGGSGARLGLNRPKAFVPLAGQPILAWSIRAFAVHPAVTDVLTVVPRGWAAEAERAILGPLRAALPCGSGRLHRPVIGGAHRQDSVRAGLEAAARLCRGGDLGRSAVLIHDAARPIVADGLIDELLACLRGAAEPLSTASGAASDQKARWRTARGAVPVVPVGDTLKTVADAAGPTSATGPTGLPGLPGPTGLPGPGRSLGHIVGTVDRDGLWRVQTPQAFPLGPVLQVHREAHAAGHRVTDDAMLFEWRGWPVAVTAGSALGIKITYPEDLALLEGWLRGPGVHRRRSGRGTRRRKE